MGFPIGLARRGEEAGTYTSDLSYRSPTIQNLRPHHENMARLVACGATPGDIARITGFSPGQITRIMASPLFQAVVARLTGEIEENAVYNVRQELENLSNKAVEIISEDLHREAETFIERKERSRVAFEVLDRAGFSKKEGPSLSLHLHKHELRDIATMGTEELLEDVLEISRHD
jgi:hypothetical protein